MSSKDINNYYDNNKYNNNSYNLYNNLDYNNNNYNQYNNNSYSNYNNNYNYNNYSNYNYNNSNNYSNKNNQYGNVIKYYNNYPVYATIPAAGYTSNATTTTSNPIGENQNTYEKKDSDLKGRTALKCPEVPKGIMLKIKPQDICHARPPEYSPGFVGQKMGVPAYARQSPNA